MRFPLPRIPGLLLVSILAALAFVVTVEKSPALVNPHIPPDPCDACHTKVPTAEQAKAGEYQLLKDNIDDLCHICHEATCCKPGSLHGGNHPSNINTWDRKKFREPKTLPLFDGYITCETCHTHRRPEGPQYKLVRIVKIDGKKIDWTELCTDCHVGY